MRLLATFLILVTLAARPAFAGGETVLGDDGLHKADWMHITFKNMREDLETANEQGKRLALIFEQVGCIYCKKMHEEVFPDPRINGLLHDKFYFVQINLFGDEEVTDFDGTVLSEKKMARRWGMIFTPTILFLPEEVPESMTAAQAAVASMPGAFGVGTTQSMLEWVLTKGYETGEHFQKFHARRVAERRAATQ